MEWTNSTKIICDKYWYNVSETAKSQTTYILEEKKKHSHIKNDCNSCYRYHRKYYKDRKCYLHVLNWHHQKTITMKRKMPHIRVRSGVEMSGDTMTKHKLMNTPEYRSCVLNWMRKIGRSEMQIHAWLEKRELCAAKILTGNWNYNMRRSVLTLSLLRCNCVMV